MSKEDTKYWKKECTKATDLAQRSLEALQHLQDVYEHHCPEHSLYSDWSPITILLLVDELNDLIADRREKIVHIADRSSVLTSNPPQYYCYGVNGERNECFSHLTDWSGWSKKELPNMPTVAPWQNGVTVKIVEW